ncbi:hypothetical protein JTB14_028132 [Gonioctena quinquepunctata]|nr:hypothetical protein JTB14_028132 [Gonioctena quinquepunctata]
MHSKSVASIMRANGVPQRNQGADHWDPPSSAVDPPTMGPHDQPMETTRRGHRNGRLLRPGGLDSDGNLPRQFREGLLRKGEGSQDVIESPGNLRQTEGQEDWATKWRSHSLLLRAPETNASQHPARKGLNSPSRQKAQGTRYKYISYPRQDERYGLSRRIAILLHLRSKAEGMHSRKKYRLHSAARFLSQGPGSDEDRGGRRYKEKHTRYHGRLLILPIRNGERTTKGSSTDPVAANLNKVLSKDPGARLEVLYLTEGGYTAQKASITPCIN